MGVLKHQATRALRTLAARVVVGRAPACLLRLGDPGVSAEHASIFWTGERWEIRDLGSSNGTYVDGRRAQPGERMPLAEVTELAFGGDAERWVLVDLSTTTPVQERYEHEGTFLPGRRSREDISYVR